MKKLGLLILLLATAVAAFWFLARPAYRHYKESRAVRQAKILLAQRDFRNASICARQALGLNPRNLEACQIMAQLAENARAPQILDWRKRIAELAPTTENKLQLVSVALLLQKPPFPLATQTLHEISSSAQTLAQFHVLSAQLAIQLNRPAEAENHFLEAARLEPTNQLHQLNAAVLQLRSPDPLRASQGRATLERLSAHPALAPLALRSLVADSLSTSNFPSALDLSSRLLAHPGSTFDDRLQHLDILHSMKSDLINSFLADLQLSASTNSPAVQSIAAWMLHRGKIDQALTWLTSLPPALQQQQPVRLALADSYIARKDWSGLDHSLQDQKWGELDFLRLGFLSRAASELHNEIAADAQWRLALHSAADNLSALSLLLDLAATANLPKAREDLLWTIVRKFPKEHWVVQELDHLYTSAGNTLALNKLYSTLTASDPADLAARNNFAATCLLLKLNLARAHDLARKNFQARPHDPILASTYAFSLHLQAKDKQALAVLQALEPQALEAPPVALYYAIVLAADGQSDKATKYFSAAKNSILLPEEKALLP